MAAAAAAAAEGGATVLSRVERIDLILAWLEEMKESHAAGSKSGGSTTTDGWTSSVSSSPTSVCRPIDEVVAETQLKGSIIDRVRFLESRLVKLEDEIENERLRAVEESKPKSEKKRHKGLKNMVKSYIKRNSKVNE